MIYLLTCHCFTALIFMLVHKGHEFMCMSKLAIHAIEVLHSTYLASKVSNYSCENSSRLNCLIDEFSSVHAVRHQSVCRKLEND